MPDREQRVREIAHRLWEEEGRPHDQDKRHWHAAERMVDAEATAKPTAAGKRRIEPSIMIQDRARAIYIERCAKLLRDAGKIDIFTVKLSVAVME